MCEAVGVFGEKVVMTDDEIMYRGFRTVWKVLGQTRPGIMNEERFILAILATCDDRFEAAKSRNKEKMRKIRKMRGDLEGDKNGQKESQAEKE